DQPPAMGKHMSYYEVVSGPLYVDGRPWPGDVAQSKAGDCYFLATLSELAGDHPDLIQQAIREAPDGTFLVRFFDAPVRGRLPAAAVESPRAIEVHIDRQLPVDQHYDLLYATKRRNSGALWPELLEKAYAKWKGGYDAIGRGGSPAHVIFSLTGW